MANSNMQATDAVAQDTASASGEFDALLNQAFRPKTTQAAKAVEAAVQTLAQQALANTITVSDDAYKSISAIIAQIDFKLTEQIKTDPATSRLAEAGILLARYGAFGLQHRDRRKAENSLHESVKR